MLGKMGAIDQLAGRLIHDAEPELRLYALEYMLVNHPSRIAEVESWFQADQGFQIRETIACFRSGKDIPLYHLRCQTEEQWDWDPDRDAALARDKNEEEEIERRDVESQARDKSLHASLTLDQLSKHRFLKEWEDPTPAVAIHTSRRLLRDTAKQLIEPGDAPGTKERLSVLQACIENFNAMNAKYGYINSTEREDICDAFDLLVYACGLKRRKTLVDKWRDW